jgi:hypothetical protein
MLRSSFIIKLLIFPLVCASQDGNFALGGRSSGLSGANLNLTDHWSIFNSPGAAAFNEGSEILLSYQNRYNLAPFQVVGLGYSRSLKWANLGIGIFRFGDEFYNQQRYFLNVSHRVGNAGIGLTINYLQYYAESIGSRSTLAFEFGGMMKIMPQLHVSGRVFNLNQARITAQETLPIVMEAGITYLPITSVLLSCEVEKNLDLPAEIIMSLEYQVKEWVALRTGFNTTTQKGAFGLGILSGWWRFDYAFVHQNLLGAIHEFSLAFSITSSDP